MQIIWFHFFMGKNMSMILLFPFSFLVLTMKSFFNYVKYNDNRKESLFSI